jgi:opacity protein-like surface antigen
MADLAASDVTITVNSREIHGDQRQCDVTIAFGDGAKTYPTTGVPIPGLNSWGMVKELKYVNMYQPTDSAGFNWYVDTTNSVLKVRGKISVTGTIAAVSIRGMAIGW